MRGRVFGRYRGIKIVCSGSPEKPGWKRLSSVKVEEKRYNMNDKLFMRIERVSKSKDTILEDRVTYTV